MDIPVADHSTSNEAESSSPGVDASLSVSLQLNGQPYRAEIEPWVTLLDLLRERLDLTGTKKGCDHGQCGACTVLVDGRRINSCLTLAVMRDGATVTTVEGLAEDGALHAAAAGLHRARRVPVRLLHARADLLGRRPDRTKAMRTHARGDARTDERQPLPLRRLPNIVEAIMRGAGAGGRRR